MFLQKIEMLLKIKREGIPTNKPTNETKMSSTRTSKSNSNSKSHSRSSKPAKSFCKVCYDAGKSEDVYTSHYVKDAPGKEGKVVCPYLLSLSCGYCKKERAGHTTRHCPELNKKEVHAAAPAPVRAAAPASENKKKRPEPLNLNLDINKYQALAVIIQAEEDEEKKKQGRKVRFASNFPMLSKTVDRSNSQLPASPTTPENYNDENPPTFNNWWATALKKPAQAPAVVEEAPVVLKEAPVVEQKKEPVVEQKKEPVVLKEAPVVVAAAVEEQKYVPAPPSTSWADME